MFNYLNIGFFIEPTLPKLRFELEGIIFILLPTTYCFGSIIRKTAVLSPILSTSCYSVPLL